MDMEDYNELKSNFRGAKLSEIAQAHLDKLLGNKDANSNEIKRAQILVESARTAEKLIESNIEGEANVYFSAAIIAGIMSEISPEALALHFAETVRDALFLRRIKDAHFDEKLTEYEDTVKAAQNLIGLFLSDDGKKVH